MLATFYIFICVLLVIAALPISNSQHYLVRSCDFVRLQVFTLGAFCAVIAAVLTQFYDSTGPYWALAGCATIMLIQGKWIYPYTWLAKKEVISASRSESHSVRIMSANVLMSNSRYTDLLRIIKHAQPDILITLESDERWQQALSELERTYPYRVYCPKDNRYGMHLYSKFKLLDSKVCELVENDVPSIHILFEDNNGEQMQGHFIHPAPPSPTEEDTSRPRDTELIILAKALKHTRRPSIVAGDLNDVAWSKTTRLFMSISGFLDPRKGRGFFNTFHAQYPFMRWPLDHLFHSPEFKVKRIERLAKYGSDHFALLTELVYSPNKSNEKYRADLDETQLQRDLKMPEHSASKVPMFENRK